MQLEGRTAVLTGATGGLGRAIAHALADKGARVLVSSRKADELTALADSLPGEGHRAIVADLALEGAAERLASEAGAVDVLVANAGISASGRLEEFSEMEVARALRVNLEAPIQMTRKLLVGMRERGVGHLVFISSLQGKAALPRSSIYSATKFGLRGFALSLREDLWESGVGVSVVLPGFIREAGIFHESGAKAPAAMGTSSPAEVGEGVATAIERNRAEVEVAPLRQRIGAAIAHRHPGLSSLVTRRAGAARIADQVAASQAPKR
jgi:short-subunit dehydrogenase